MTTVQIALLPEDVAAIEAALQRSGSANTKRGYEGAWRKFAAWCEGRGYPSLPAAPKALSAYLLSLERDGKKLATIRLHRAAVVAQHKASGLTNPADEEVRRVMAGQAASLGGEQKQAMPLGEAEFAVIRRTAAIPRRRADGSRENLDYALRRGAEDIAIISVMRDALLRVGESAALTWGDVRPWHDGNGRLYIRRSKTDQLAVGALVYLGEQAMRDLETMREFCTSSEDSDAVFPVSAGWLSSRIKAAAMVAGLGSGFSGHSPRVGMAIDLGADGSGLPELQQAARWMTADMVRRYLRGTTAGQGPVARFYARRKTQGGEVVLEPPPPDWFLPGLL